MNLRENSVGPHFANRGVTPERYWLGDEPTTSPSPPPDDDIEWIYEGCGDTKVCYGIPENCVEQRNCDIFGGVTDNFGNFEFELLGLGKKNLNKKVLNLFD